MREEHSERVLMEQEKQKAAEQEEAFKQIKLERKMSETVNEIQNADTSTPEETPEEPIGEYKPNGVIAVSSGDGISEMFRELGADYIIGGGQTMNPSTEDILSAVKRVNAGDIYIFPNNSNIIMAANQAASIYKEKKLHVIPSKTIPQGIAAIINYDPEGDAESNVSAMTEAMSSVKTGEVTYAIRDTSFEGKTIHKNNIMGIGDKGIENVGEDVTEVTLNLIETMIDDESGLITVYFGQDATQEDADKLAEKLGEIYPDVDVDVHEGKQPIYYYIISVE
jgi:dihydroxyacetone kinase-like predicted kinase